MNGPLQTWLRAQHVMCSLFHELAKHVHESYIAGCKEFYSSCTVLKQFHLRSAVPMALVDSQATFQVHCDKIDPSGWLKGIMATNRLRTFSDLGFAVGTPQAPAAPADFDGFCTQLNGGTDMTISEVSRVRRLHFEACTLIVAHTKQQVTLDANVEGSRKLPAAEKQARLQQQQARLSGLHIAGELQPSHSLIDLAASMLESNTIIWIGPSTCTKRESEIQVAATKEKSQVLSIEQQTVKVTAAESTLKADDNTELQLQWCFQRRGIALDQCRLIEWDLHQRWVQYLLGLLSKPAPDGYAKIKMDQVIKADKELFMIMSEEHQQSGSQLTDTPSPMNVAFQKLLTDPRVTMFLLPVPVHATVKSAPSSSGAAAANSGGKNGAKGQGKVRKEGKQSQRAKALCPNELKDFKQVDDQGKPICWAYNMKSGCKESVQNGRCKKGAHICMKCLRNNHGVPTCRSNA